MSFFEFPNARTYDSDLGWLIRQFLNLSAGVEDLSSKVDALIENLPEEVRNQLQEMIDDGSFSLIIQQLLENVMPVYNSTSEMAEDTELAVGRYALTAGYNEKNDGGGGLYYIESEGEIDSGEYIQVINGAAHLITGAEVSVKQFGAAGTGDTDEYTQINNALQFAARNHKRLIVPAGTYLISQMLLCEEKYDFAVIGEKGGLIKYMPDASAEGSHSVLGFEGSYNFEISNIEIDASDVLGLNGIGANGRNNTNLLLTNVYIHDVVIRNVRISDTDLGGHAITLQYNIGRALVNNISVYDSDIAIDVTGVTRQGTLDEGYYASGVVIDGINAYNCETVVISYDLQTNINIVKPFNQITISNIYAYHCGLSKYATQTNNHLNTGAAGDGTDGGVFEFVGACRNITIRDAFIDNSDWIKIGGVVRGKGCYCRLDNITFIGDAIAVYNASGPFNVAPINVDVGVQYHSYADFNDFDIRVSGAFDYVVLLQSVPNVSDPYKLRYANITVRTDGVSSFESFSNEQWPLTTYCTASIIKQNGSISGAFFELFKDFTIVSYNNVDVGWNKIIRNANFTVSGYNSTQNFTLQREGTSGLSKFRMACGNGATEITGGLTDFSKHLMRFRHNDTLTGVEIDGGYNSGYLKIGNVYLWENGGRIYYKNGMPSSATDGTVI